MNSDARNGAQTLPATGITQIEAKHFTSTESIVKILQDSFVPARRFLETTRWLAFPQSEQQ